jgi:hypothetical protein
MPSTWYVGKCAYELCWIYPCFSELRTPTEQDVKAKGIENVGKPLEVCPLSPSSLIGTLVPYLTYQLVDFGAEIQGIFLLGVPFSGKIRPQEG